MPPQTEFIAAELSPCFNRGPWSLFVDLREFWNFLVEELKPFPGRGHAVVRIVASVLVAMLLSETLRVPDPSFSAYLIFFVANEDGISSLKFGLAAMTGVTLGLAIAMGINICFMDAPWFRLPVTLGFIAVAMWLSRVLVLGPLGRLMAIVLVLCLSLADTVFDPESLTQATLYLWPIIGLAVGVSVLMNFILEPRPDLLFRAELATRYEAVSLSLRARAEGKILGLAQSKTLRRLLYSSSQRLRQLLGRWQQRKWPERYDTVDWDLAILIAERLLAAAVTLAATNERVTDEATRKVLIEIARALEQLQQAVRERNPHLLETLEIPSAQGLPEGPDSVAAAQLIAALSHCRDVLTPRPMPEAELSDPSKGAPKSNLLIPDALTNPDYIRFAAKATLVIMACEVFMNAVAWPGIRTCMITCAVTALATAGAERQKQLLRVAGVFAGGLMGLVSVLYFIPRMDSIVSLSLLIGTGTAICAWVGAGSIRSSYGGYQMALAFYLMLLPGFATSIDLTAIRDRFVGVLVGITAMWIIFNHLWHTSSRRQIVEKMIAILQRMAQTVKVISPTQSPAEAHRVAASCRESLTHELAAARQYLDETRIEMTLAIQPRRVHKDQLEELGKEMSFAALELLALNDRKVDLLAAGELDALAPLMEPEDSALVQNFSELANKIERDIKASSQSADLAVSEDLLPVPLPSPSAGFDAGLQFLYQTLGASTQRMANLIWMARALS